MEGREDDQCAERASDHPSKLQKSNENTAESYAVADTQIMKQHPAQNIIGCETNVRTREWKRKGAVGMAGFMFWSNAIGVVLLIIGLFTPGWLTVKADQELYYQADSYYSYDDRILRGYVYQDYSLWYITQCYDHGSNYKCETMTYRTIKAISVNACPSYNCYKLVIGSMEITDAASLIFFSNAAIVFSYSEIVRSQALYTVGLLLAVVVLFACYKFRKGVAEDKRIGLTKKQWVLFFLVEVIAAIFLFVPVISYTVTAGEIRGEYSDKLESPVGIVFAGLGCGMIALCAATLLMHLLCCRNEEGAYFCSPGVESGMEVPEEEEDV